MNIFTASSPDINPDKFIVKEPASSTQNNDNVESSRFAKLFNDAEKSASKTEDKKESYSKKEDMTPSKPEPAKNHDEVKTGQSESRPDASQETGDDKTDQQVSHDDQSRNDKGTEGKLSEGKTDKNQNTEVKESEFADNDIKGDEVEDTDNSDNDTGNVNPQVAELVTAAIEQALSAETSIPHQSGDQAAAAVDNSGETTSSNAQSNNGSTLIKSEGKGNVSSLVMDEVVSDEMKAEDGEPDDSGADNNASNKHKGFGNSALEELPDEFDLNEELKEKIKLSATRELPDRYARKTVIDQSENKTIQSQINAVDPEVLEELNNVKTLQDGLLSGNTQNPANNSGLTNTLKGVSDTTLNSLESLHSNTTITNAELAQIQANTMAGGKAGAGLSHANAARTAGFSELLNHVVYVAKGRNKLGVTVNHEEFGKLKINVSMEKGIMNIHVNASEKVVREFLESNVQSIVESLSKDGVNVGGFSVALKDHKDNPEKKFLMDSGLNRQYENIPASIHSAEGLVNVFA